MTASDRPPGAGVSAGVSASADPGADGGATEATVDAMRVPDFFIIGHHKSGTTALYEMLRRHPQLYLPDLKEPKWFAGDLRPLLNPSPASAVHQTYEQYLALFAAARPDQRIGDASPSYLRSEVAAGAIAAVRPDARCIAILREPASFVRSLHLQMVQEHVEEETDLRRAVEQEELVKAGRHVRRYSDHVRYADQLRRFHDVFGREQVLVLIYDDFRRDNEQTLRTVLRFLDVDEDVAIDPVEANPSVTVRSVRADRALSSLYGSGSPVGRVVKGGLRALVPARARRALMRTARQRVVYGRPVAPDEQLMSDLRERYRDEVVAISEYLGRDLVAEWGYEDRPAAG
jgi:hypothetical protein